MKSAEVLQLERRIAILEGLMRSWLPGGDQHATSLDPDAAYATLYAHREHLFELLAVASAKPQPAGLEVSVMRDPTGEKD